MIDSPELLAGLGAQILRSTLVVLGLLTLRLALTKWLAPPWLYGICLLGALWLLLPVTPSSPLSLWQILAPSPEQVTWTIQTAEGTEQYLAPLASTAPVTASSPGSTGNLLPPTNGGVASSHSPRQPGMSLTTALLGIWASGVLLLLAIWSSRELRFLRQMRQSARPVTDPHLLQLLAEAKEQLSISRPVALTFCSSPLSPALAGLLRPAILMQEDMSGQLSDDQIRQIFMHELARLKRQDLMSQALFRLTAILHWYNPVASWLCRAAKRDRELATDALVLRHLAPTQHHDYGSTLLHVARLLSTRPTHMPISLLGMASPQLKNLQTRIHMIDRSISPSQSRWALALASLTIALLAVGIGFQPANAQDAPPALDPDDLMGELKVSAEIYEIPASKALDFSNRHKGGSLSEDAHKELMALGQAEDGRLISNPTIICRSGQRAKVEGGKNLRFLSAYELKDEQEVPKYTEVFVGADLEVDPVLGPNRQLIDLALILSYSVDPEVRETEFLTPQSKTMAKVQMPQEKRASVITSSTFRAGDSKIVGTAASPLNEGMSILFVITAEVF